MIERIYAHIKLPISEAFRGRVRQAVRENLGYRSANHYSLEEYGLSESEVYAELADVFEFLRGCCLSARGSLATPPQAAVADPALVT
jgi:hypothetical protein